MYVQKTIRKTCLCSICGNTIMDEFRVVSFKRREAIYYHIDCIIEFAHALKSKIYVEKVRKGYKGETFDLDALLEP